MSQQGLPAPPPLKTLDDFIKMCFWEVLGLQRGEADPAVIHRAFRKMSLRYHPEKGGDATTFAFLHMVSEVLSDPEKRMRYEVGGPDFFTGPFRPNNADGDDAPRDPDPAKAPPINRTFLEELRGAAAGTQKTPE